MSSKANDENPFDHLFQDATYLSLKTSLFNYRYRKWKISKHVRKTGLILDIGSGTAPVSPDLARSVVADISAEALKKIDCASKCVTSITNMSFGRESFDCILCSEVLEHINDDAKAISELRRVLKPGGALIVTVPFQKSFWAEDDEFVGHVRRYEPGELEQKLHDAGFRSVATHKLSGTVERWLTRRSLHAYREGRSLVQLPFGFLKAANLALFLFLIIAELFTTWKRTTRILIVAGDIVRD